MNMIINDLSISSKSLIIYIICYDYFEKLPFHSCLQSILTHYVLTVFSSIHSITQYYILYL